MRGIKEHLGDCKRENGFLWWQNWPNHLRAAKDYCSGQSRCISTVQCEFKKLMWGAQENVPWSSYPQSAGMRSRSFYTNFISTLSTRLSAYNARQHAQNVFLQPVNPKLNQCSAFAPLRLLELRRRSGAHGRFSTIALIEATEDGA